ncbi:MAG: hypothetical protein JNL70_17310 [Saprospiraceae bacterium]|nr:hypothetical protein [Saprospiraceae bacterium]
MEKCLFFFLLCTQMTAQTVDEWALNLTQNESNDSMKVVRIYDWVTKNIVYDHRFRYSREEGDTTLWQEPYHVVEKKKAVCIGYAKLIKALCQKVEIQVEVVDGWTKNARGEIDQQEHAWNVAKINNNWYLLDATWGADSRQTAQKYFLTTPSVFLEDHFPHDPMWQLVENPIDFDCFINKKTCQTIAQFNFRDTIKTWQSQDSLTQMMEQGQRMLRYARGNVHAIRSLANGHSGRALEAYTAYFKLRNTFLSKKKETSIGQKSLELLNETEYHLRQAIEYYERLTTFAHKGVRTDADINREAMLDNLEKLKEERAFLESILKK